MVCSGSPRAGQLQAVVAILLEPGRADGIARGQLQEPGGDKDDLLPDVGVPDDKPDGRALG